MKYGFIRRLGNTVPEMGQDELISENSDSEVSESDEEGEFDKRKAQEIF